MFTLIIFGILAIIILTCWRVLFIAAAWLVAGLIWLTAIVVCVSALVLFIRLIF